MRFFLRYRIIQYEIVALICTSSSCETCTVCSEHVHCLSRVCKWLSTHSHGSKKLRPGKSVRLYLPKEYTIPTDPSGMGRIYKRAATALTIRSTTKRIAVGRGPKTAKQPTRRKRNKPPTMPSDQ